MLPRNCQQCRRLHKKYTQYGRAIFRYFIRRSLQDINGKLAGTKVCQLFSCPIVCTVSRAERIPTSRASMRLHRYKAHSLCCCRGTFVHFCVMTGCWHIKKHVHGTSSTIGASYPPLDSWQHLNTWCTHAKDAFIVRQHSCILCVVDSILSVTINGILLATNKNYRIICHCVACIHVHHNFHFTLIVY